MSGGRVKSSNRERTACVARCHRRVTSTHLLSTAKTPFFEFPGFAQLAKLERELRNGSPFGGLQPAGHNPVSVQPANGLPAGPINNPPESKHPSYPMNHLAQWHPFISLLDPMFRLTPGEAPVAAWAPSVDVFKTDDAFLFAAELPGVRKEDVDVHIENGVLILSGQRKLEQ